MSDQREDVIFERRTNEVVRAFFIKGNESQATPAVIQELARLPYRLSELLMHHEGICFSVYGENVIIPVLLKAYGIGGLISLLEQGALRFRLQTTGVVHIEDSRRALCLDEGNRLVLVHPHSEFEKHVRIMVRQIGKNQVGVK